jgi:hypothetical protein
MMIPEGTILGDDALEVGGVLGELGKLDVDLVQLGEDTGALPTNNVVRVVEEDLGEEGLLVHLKNDVEGLKDSHSKYMLLTCRKRTEIRN